MKEIFNRIKKLTQKMRGMESFYKSKKWNILDAPNYLKVVEELIEQIRLLARELQTGGKLPEDILTPLGKKPSIWRRIQPSYEKSTNWTIPYSKIYKHCKQQQRLIKERHPSNGIGFGFPKMKSNYAKKLFNQDKEL